MGVWGYNNFESDAALNALAGWINQLIEKIRLTFTYDSLDSLYDRWGEASIIANVDILGTLFSEYQPYPDLQLDEVLQWKREYLATFDRIYAKFAVDSSSVEWTTNRRLVVEETFDRLLAILKKIIEQADHNLPE